LIVDEIGYLPLIAGGANLFFGQPLRAPHHDAHLQSRGR
jgi:hypothetical protein